MSRKNKNKKYFDIPFYLVKKGAGWGKTLNHCHYQPRAPATILLSECTAGGRSCQTQPKPSISNSW